MNTEFAGGKVAPAGSRIWQAMVQQKNARYSYQAPPWGPSWEFYNLDSDLAEVSSVTSTMNSALKQQLKDELLGHSHSLATPTAVGRQASASRTSLAKLGTRILLKRASLYPQWISRNEMPEC